jgi:hypothetical protein
MFEAKTLNLLHLGHSALLAAAPVSALLGSGEPGSLTTSHLTFFFGPCRWRGIPRYVLDKLDDAEQGLLTQAIDSANLASLVKAAGLSASPQDASHRILT